MEKSNRDLVDFLVVKGFERGCIKGLKVFITLEETELRYICVNSGVLKIHRFLFRRKSTGNNIQ